MARITECDFESNKSIVVASGDVTQSLERIFNYKLGDKKAKSNFLKGAAKEVLEIEEKGVCTMLNFSVGSYHETVIPTVEEWMTHGLRINGEYMKITEILPSFDENKKHVETIVKIMMNNTKITVTFYNTTQRVKIEGRGYVDCGRNIIIPLFREKIASVPLGKIEQYNKDVIAALSGKRKVVSRPVRSVRYKSTAKLPCSKCEITFMNSSQLNRHKITKHVSDVNNIDSSIKCLTLAEDLSLADLSDNNIVDKIDDMTTDEVTLEEICTEPKNTCIVAAEIEEEKIEQPVYKCEKCEYSTLKKTDIERHMKAKHEGEVVMDVENVKSIQEEPQNLINHKLVTAESEKELKIHIQSNHECEKCGYKSNDEKDMKIHFQTTHESVRVNLLKENRYKKIKCEECKYECRYNKQLQKHSRSHHGEDKDTRIYSCDACPYTTLYVGQLWEHVLDKHPGKDKEFSPKTSKDILFNLLAEQNMDLLEEVRSIKNGMKNSFNQLAGDFDKTLNEVNEKAEERDQENKEIIRKLCEEVEQLKENIKCSPTLPPCPQPAPVHSSVPERTKPKTAYQARKKVLYVGDSMGRNVNFPKIESEVKCTIKTAKAYSAAHDKDAKWPDSNYTEVVDKELTKQTYDTLVMTAPTVDITNLDTSKLKEEDSTDVYQQIVFVSCQNMISTAHRAIQQQNLEQVILMEHPPRFDSKELDPIGLKPKLAKLANSMFNQLWLDSPHKNKIIIGNHRLDDSSSGDKFAAMFANKRTGNYNGVVHDGGMGSRGRGLYSDSVKNVFKNTAKSQNSRTTQESPLPNNYHQEQCPQAAYQRKQKMKHTRYHPSVQDKNRFSVFNSNQGNM